MAPVPASVAAFLESDRIAVVGVSHEPRDFSRAVYRRLAGNGREVVPVNPHAADIEGVRCYPDLASIPDPVDSVMVVAPPGAVSDIVAQAAQKGASRIWLHRSFGQGSVSDSAQRECATRGIDCIVGGCPLMYCEPVDLGHKCMRWWLSRSGRVPV